MKKVLQGGPSDHSPFLCDFTAGYGLRLRAVTYNVNHGSDITDLRSMFKRIEGFSPGIWLLQEVKRHKGILRWFKAGGYGVAYANPEYAIVWDPEEWEYLRHWAPLMSPTKYWTTNYALVVVLRHRQTGLVGKFVSYHPPAHVQRPDHPTFPVVSRVLREWKVTLNRIARRNYNRSVLKAGGIDFVLAGGDDNVDESKGWAPPGGWDFMLDGPLRQISPPTGTHGDRKIDDFRVRGLLIGW